MLVRDFIKNIANEILIVVYDYDNKTIKEGLAGELAPAYRNNYNSFVTDFSIDERAVHISIERF